MMRVILGTRAVETAVTSLAPFLAMPSFSYFFPTCVVGWLVGWLVDWLVQKKMRCEK
jgi:hypothetical protein